MGGYTMLKQQRGFADLIILAVYAIGAAMFIGGLWYAKHSYDEGKRKEGDARTTLVFQPKLDACEVDLKTARSNVAGLKADMGKLAAANTKANEAVTALEDANRKALAARDVAVERLKSRERTLFARIAELSAINNGPPASSKAASCDAAEKILGDYAVEVNK
jgi:hypothetical protein